MTALRERHTIDTLTHAHTAYSWAVRGEVERVMTAVDAMSKEARAAAALGAALLAACLERIGGAR